MPSDGSLVLFRVAAKGVSRRPLTAFARTLRDEVADGREFCCLIADDAELRTLNRKFRGCDYPTDVLSFPSGAGLHPASRFITGFSGARAVNAGPATKAGSKPACRIESCPTLGEIAISYDRAREQARQLGHETGDELRILLLHGVLHLCGLDHERDRGRMARLEKRWRQRFGLPAGLIERVRA